MEEFNAMMERFARLFGPGLPSPLRDGTMDYKQGKPLCAERGGRDAERVGLSVGDTFRHSDRIRK